MTKRHSGPKAAKLDAYETDLEKNIEKAIPLSKEEKQEHSKKLKRAAETYATDNC